MANLISTIETFADGASTVTHTDGGNVFFIPELFDSLVREHGVLLEHFIALPCPQSDKNINNVRSNHSDHDCENGYYYVCSGTFLGIITNNPKTNYYKSEGIIDSATCWIIVPRFYEKDGKTIYFSPYDKVYIADPQYKEVLVPNFELMESSTTGTDRLRFPITKITHLIDKHGKPSYTEGSDYIVTNDGNLKWISQNRPQFNPTLQEGGVYSVRYLYQPFWYIATVEHEIRISKMINPSTEEKQAVRLPQYLRCVRERFFRDKENIPQSNDPQEAYVPSSGKNLPWR